MGETFDRVVQGAARCEGADVQLVDHTAGRFAAGPVGVVHRKRAGIEDGRRAVHAVGEPARSRIGQDPVVVVEQEAVPRSFHGLDRILRRRRQVPPAGGIPTHRVHRAVQRQPDARNGCPHRERVGQWCFSVHRRVRAEATRRRDSRRAGRPPGPSRRRRRDAWGVTMRFGRKVDRRVAPAVKQLQTDGQPCRHRHRSSAGRARPGDRPPGRGRRVRSTAGRVRAGRGGRGAHVSSPATSPGRSRRSAAAPRQGH